MSQKLVYLLTVMGISAFLLAGCGRAEINSTTRGEPTVPSLDIKIGDSNFTTHISQLCFVPFYFRVYWQNALKSSPVSRRYYSYSEK